MSRDESEDGVEMGLLVEGEGVSCWVEVDGEGGDSKEGSVDFDEFRDELVGGGLDDDL